MERWPLHFEMPKENAWAEDAEHTDSDSNRTDLRVGRFVGGLPPVDYYSLGFHLQLEWMPAEGRDLGTSAGRRLNLCDESLADKILAGRRTGPQSKPDQTEGHQQRGPANDPPPATPGSLCRLGLQRRFRKDHGAVAPPW